MDYGASKNASVRRRAEDKFAKAKQRDMDVMGHVNNAMYFRYLETVRIDWMASLGQLTNKDGEGFVIINAYCNFYTQLEYPGEVLAKHYVAHPGRTSFDTFITLERTDMPGVIYASGGAKTVWVNYSKQKSVPLPQQIRDLIV